MIEPVATSWTRAAAIVVAMVALALVLDGISDKTSQVQGSKDDGRLRAASLDLDDTGLLAKVLPALAKSQGTKT